MRMIRRILKVPFWFAAMLACVGIGFQLGRRTDISIVSLLSDSNRRKLVALARTTLRRLRGWPTSRTLQGRALRELTVVRGQNDRILRQNERIYLQNDRILAILEGRRAPERTPSRATADTLTGG